MDGCLWFDEEPQPSHVDPTLGGSFAFVDVRDGEQVEHVGNYLDIDRPHPLAFTWRAKPEEESSIVSVDIIAHCCL